MAYFGVLSRDLRIDISDFRVSGVVREIMDEAAFGNVDSGRGM